MDTLLAGARALRGQLLRGLSCLATSATLLAQAGRVDAEWRPAEGLTLSHIAGALPLTIPADEVLEFDVVLNLAVFGDTKVGTVTLSAGVEPYVSGLPGLGSSPATDLFVGWIKSQARGSYLSYDLDHEIEMRALPQAWPRVIYRDTQTGSENRKRELKYGHRDGSSTAEYRSDTHCKDCERLEHYVEGAWPFGEDHHCKKCKRAEHRHWREPTARTIPEGAFDMLSAIYYSRAMMRAGLQEISVPLLDRDKLWELTLTRGKERTVRTGAGRFRCQEIQLATAVPSGEPDQEEEFRGLFGIHGTIAIWLERDTGVPVEVAGRVPLGPLDFDVRLSLRSFRGTPPDFQILGKETK